jgi:hypothetical protein
MTIMKRINKAPLTAELMKRMVMLLDRTPANQRAGVEDRAQVIFHAIDQYYPDLDAMDRAAVMAAFEFRMLALEKLMGEPEYRAWTLRLPTGEEMSHFVQPALIEAAAEEPLIEQNDEPSFNPVSFFKRVLAISETGGRA